MRATLELPPSIALLEAALEGLVQANVVLIRAGKVPPSPLDSAVRYERERDGFEDWNIATRVIEQGTGDCEDLNGWQVAGHIADGSDEGARLRIVRTGRRTFHAVCQLSSGEMEDVCPELGMRKRSSDHSLPGARHLETDEGGGRTSSLVVGAPGFVDLVNAATKAASLPGTLKNQVRREARAGVTPIVMVAIGLALLAMTRR